MINLILCGGAGTRLWPLSRTEMPKQFIKLFDHKSLYQMNIERNAVHCDKNLVISSQHQFFLALGQTTELGIDNCQYILEPIGRNTAPAIALACLSLEADDIVLVTASDHLIKDQLTYQQSVQRAKRFAEQGYLVTFGLTPKYAETGFGYIESVDQENVIAFHEKPDIVTAEEYLHKGNYYWNSGMFCFKAGVFLAELQQYSPDIYQACIKTYQSAVKKEKVLSFELNDMQSIPAKSIDYAVMEHSQKIKVVCADFSWSDVGSFTALEKEFPQDEQGNAGNTSFQVIEGKDNFFITEKKVVAIDIDDVLLIELDNTLFLSKKSSVHKGGRDIKV